MKSVSCFLLIGCFMIACSDFTHAQWIQTNGPCSGSIISMAIDGTDLYVGSGGGGIFKSTNGGTSFSSTTNDLYSTTITAIRVESYGVFVGTGGSGIFLSTNRGSNWKPKSTGISNLNINSIAAIGSTLFAGTSGGVFRSSDQGANWTAVNSGLTNLSINTLYVNGTTLYAGTSNGGFVSADNGATWAVITASLSNKNIKAFKANGTRLFIGNNTGVFYSDNNGTSWTTPSANTGSAVNTFELIGTTLFAGTNGSGCFRSQDNGATWTATNAYSGLFNLYGNVLLKNGTTLYYCSGGGGLYRSTNNGSSWVDNNSGLTTSTVNGVYSANGVLYAGVYGGGIHISTNGGDSWSAANSGVTSTNIKTFTSNGSTVFAGASSSGGVYYSTNNGASWTQCHPNKSIFALATVTGGAGGTKILACAGDGLYTSTNNGSQWTKHNSIPTAVVQAIDFDGSLGLVGIYNSAPYISTDYGDTWTKLSGTLPFTSVLSVDIEGTSIIVGTYNGAHRTTNNGTNWETINTGLPANLTINALVSIPSSGGIAEEHNVIRGKIQKEGLSSFPLGGSVCVAATQGDGLFVTTDRGNTWTQINDGLSGAATTDYAACTDGTTCYTGSFACGVQKRTESNIRDTYYPILYTIALSVNPPNSGTVGGAGKYKAGYGLELSLFPAKGYKFVSLTENGVVVAQSNYYRFFVDANRTFVANFELVQYTITTSSNPSHCGTTSGGGTFDYNSTRTVTATVNPGFRFVNWTEKGTIVSSQASYTFTVEGDRTLVANYVPIQYAITTNGNPTNAGTTSGGGTYDGGSSVTVTAVPASGCQFINWTENGTIVSPNASYLFTVDRSRTLTANFRVIQPPAKTTNPFPADKTSNVPPTVHLSWNNPDSPIDWTKVFLVQFPATVDWNGTAVLSTSDIVSSYTPAQPLESGKVYLWGISQGNQFGTTQNGPFTFTTMVMTDVENLINQTMPAGFALYQNYPNPSNPSTSIRFDVPRSARVKISLYNELGKEIMIIADKTFSAGAHIASVRFDNLVSGVYFYKMESENFRETKKINFLK